MKIKSEEILDKIILENAQESGSYDIFVAYKDNTFNKLIGSMIFDQIPTAKKYILGSFNVDKEKNTVEYIYNKDIYSEKYFKRLIVNLIVEGSVDIKKKEPPKPIYFYFNDNLEIVTREDKGEEKDKVNKETHNYFLEEEYNRNTLERNMREHICNMKLNLLASFYPKLKGDE